jgi:hypothetical protein
VRDVFPIICSTRNNRWQYFSTAFLVSLAVFVVLTASCPAKEIGVVTRNRREPYIAIRCIQRLRMDRHTEFWCRIEPSAAIQARIAAIETKMGGCFIRCVIVFDCAGDINIVSLMVGTSRLRSPLKIAAALALRGTPKSRNDKVSPRKCSPVVAMPCFPTRRLGDLQACAVGRWLASAILQ